MTGYRPIFNPDACTPFEQPGQERADETTRADQNLGRNYVFSPDIVLAVNVAIATGRPLLVRGPSGSGKSSLAQGVAYCMGWRYYQKVITSRTQARDILWQFDALRRLSDAQAHLLTRKTAYTRETMARYIEPGVLWWAFNPETAMLRGLPAKVADIPDAREPAVLQGRDRAVVLLDEIDKADPDVPNDLLEPLGNYTFRVEELDALVELPEGAEPPLLIVTSNDERDLPPAFKRRCVPLWLCSPDCDRLVQIANKRWPTTDDSRKDLYKSIAQIVAPKGPSADAPAQPTPGGDGSTANQPRASTAEYIDAVNACVNLGITTIDDPMWNDIATNTLWKWRSQPRCP